MTPRLSVAQAFLPPYPALSRKKNTGTNACATSSYRTVTVRKRFPAKVRPRHKLPTLALQNLLNPRGSPIASIIVIAICRY